VSGVGGAAWGWPGQRGREEGRAGCLGCGEWVTVRCAGGAALCVWWHSRKKKGKPTSVFSSARPSRLAWQRVPHQPINTRLTYHDGRPAA
jgi:hypothetical protein